MSKKILLVNPPETEQSGFTNPPLGLLYLASTLLKEGFAVQVADGCIDGKAAVEQALTSFRPDIVGITCLTPERMKALAVARMAKKIDPSVTVVFGGAHPTIMYRQMLEAYPFIDYVVLGEGELALLELAQQKEPAEIKGIAYRKDGQVVKTPNRHYIEKIDTIPHPAWHLVNLSKYPAWGEGAWNGVDLAKEPRISVIFSRGCTGHCDFCSTWWIWRGWRHRSARDMVDELEALVTRHHIRHFCFADDALTVDRQATIDLCDEIMRRGLRIAFHVTTRTDCVDETVLSKLKDAGCYKIAFGIETGSPVLLDKMGKENDIVTSERAIGLCKKVGLPVTALMIIGNVGETDKTVQETVDFLKRTDPDEIGCVGGLWILPGTKLYRDCVKKGIIDDAFWLGNKPYDIYTEEHSLRELKQLQRRIVYYSYRAAIRVFISKVRRRLTKIISRNMRNEITMRIAKLKNIVRITLDSELRSIRNVIRAYDENSTVSDALVSECDSIFKNRMTTYPIAYKMSFWKDHFDWKSLDEYPEIAGRLLDFGCGSGHPDVYLARSGRSVHGIDMSPLGIRIANYLRERESDAVKARLSFSVADVTKVIPEKRFDSIWSSNVFEHIVDPLPVLNGLRSWLKPKGFLLISVPYGDAYDDPGHVNHFYNDEQVRVFFSKNLHIVKIDTSLRDKIIRVLCRFD